MIRRLLVTSAVVVGLLGLTGGTASAAQDVVCVYNHNPLHVGVCLAL